MAAYAERQIAAARMAERAGAFMKKVSRQGWGGASTAERRVAGQALGREKARLSREREGEGNPPPPVLRKYWV